MLSAVQFFSVVRKVTSTVSFSMSKLSTLKLKVLWRLLRELEDCVNLVGEAVAGFERAESQL